MTPDTLLELQLVDTATDQLRFRLPKLAEVIAETTARQAVTAWEKRRVVIAAQIQSAEDSITDAETKSAAISKQRDRLEAQMKTVIALREAEALQHEIANLTAQRSALDDLELEALDAMAQGEAELAEHLAQEPVVRDAAVNASQAATAARLAAQNELDRMAAQRVELRDGFTPDVIKMYDTMRGQHSGVAVAKLNGLRCEGCHLDLSRAEVDRMKTAPPEDLPECPNCGRLLVR